MIQPYGPGQSVVDMLRGYQAFRDNRDESKWAAGGMEGAAPTLRAGESQAGQLLSKAQKNNLNANTDGMLDENSLAKKRNDITRSAYSAITDTANADPKFFQNLVASILGQDFDNGMGNLPQAFTASNRAMQTGRNLFGGSGVNPSNTFGNTFGNDEGGVSSLLSPEKVKLPTSFFSDLLQNIGKTYFGGNDPVNIEPSPTRNKGSAGSVNLPKTGAPTRNRRSDNEEKVELPTSFLQDFGQKLTDLYWPFK